MAASQADYLRVVSPVCRIVWAGWETTTLALQQAGWEIAVEEDMSRYHAVRLLLRHRAMKVYAYTNPVYGRDFDQHATYSHVIFNVVALTSQTPMVIHGDLTKYRQIDAEPQFITHAPRSLDDMRIFATPLARTEEIIVEPQDVSALLEQIKRMQAPGQRAIRERDRSRERLEAAPREIFHAQILSFAEAA